MPTVEINEFALRELIKSALILQHYRQMGVDRCANYSLPDNLEKRIEQTLENIKNG